MQYFKLNIKIMHFPNKNKLNLIFDIILDFLIECYILWNMKLLLMIKLGLAIKKILNVYDVNFLNYLSKENSLVIEYVEQKLVVMRKDNAAMKLYLEKKDNLETFTPNLLLLLSQEFKEKSKYEGEFAKIAGNIKKESKTENAEESSALK